ncbi:MAG TPA: nucleoside deaminase [Spirochaetota bacterium]|nr:nucleoside deaminase [Spirochaetota bacterium]
MTTNDILFMREALVEAATAGAAGEIPIGAVIVRDGEIIARAHNTNRGKKNPVCHAETLAIMEACRVTDNERLGGCSLYVTKEPCAMCAGAIIHSRIEKVFIAAKDIKYGACGTVFPILGNSGFNHVPEIQFGLLEEEAEKMLKDFFAELRNGKKTTGRASL